MFDPAENLNSLLETGFSFLGLMFEVFFGPVLLLVVGPLTQISEYFSNL